MDLWKNYVINKIKFSFFKNLIGGWNSKTYLRLSNQMASYPRNWRALIITLTSYCPRPSIDLCGLIHWSGDNCMHISSNSDFVNVPFATHQNQIQTKKLTWKATDRYKAIQKCIANTQKKNTDDQRHKNKLNFIHFNYLETGCLVHVKHKVHVFGVHDKFHALPWFDVDSWQFWLRSNGKMYIAFFCYGWILLFIHKFIYLFIYLSISIDLCGCLTWKNGTKTIVNCVDWIVNRFWCADSIKYLIQI